MMLHEPATALTDYLLTLECAWFAVILARSRPAGFLRAAFIVLFASVAAASFTGGTVHGFFPDAASAGNRLLWLATLLGLGVTAAAMFTVALRVAVGEGRDQPIAMLAAIAWVAYAAAVLWISREFLVAIVFYLPAALFLLLVLARHWVRHRGAGAAAGIIGVLLALLGAAGQQSGVALHPVHFDHNAVYHVVQGVALYLLLRCGLDLIDA